MSSSELHFVLLRGPSGSGKTTLMHSLTRESVVVGAEILTFPDPFFRVLRKVATRPSRPSDGDELTSIGNLQFLWGLVRRSIIYPHRLKRNGYLYGINSISFCRPHDLSQIGTMGSFNVLSKIKRRYGALAVYVTADFPVLEQRVNMRLAQESERRLCLQGIHHELDMFHAHENLFDAILNNNGRFIDAHDELLNIVNTRR